MDSPTPFLHVVSGALPTELSKSLRVLCSSPSSETLLDNLIRFVCGADCAVNSHKDTENQWVAKQVLVRQKLGELSGSSKKRGRDDVDGELAGSEGSKRQKTDIVASTAAPADDPPLFTLHSISVTSPVRKKVNIAIHESSIRFINPASSATEASIPLSSFRRGFLLPTRGKAKPHWTVVLMSNDIPDKAKTPASQSNHQVIFGLDALASSPSAVSFTNHESQSPTESLKKGDETLPLLTTFFSYLRLATPFLQPSVEHFKSICGGNANGGVPGIEANRNAKSGSLWFLPEGILWGESKPCEFWAVEDLMNKNEGLRVLSATGRVCTVILTRRPAEGEDDDGEVGEETAFGQIDGKEQEAINQWLRKFRNLFGVRNPGGAESNANANATGAATASKSNVPPSPSLPKASAIPAGPITINQLADTDDEEDEEFAVDSDDDSASESSDDDDDEDEDEAEGTDEEGANQDAQGSDEEEEEEEEEEELKPENHPLMRPGAMPRMSRAAIDMVVGMVEQDLVGGGGDEEEDELED